MRAIFIVLGIGLVLLTLLGLLGEYKIIAFKEHFAAAMDKATKRKEGFTSKNGATASSTSTPTGHDEPLIGSTVNAETNEKLIASPTLIPMTKQESNDAWGKMTSEKCLRYDVSEPLNKTRNYLQRTNNYARTHPDSCTAPNHEFVGTFYRPHEGVGATPPDGQTMPRGALFA